MAKVIGVGGVFFKSKNPKKLCAWYQKNLGFTIGPGFTGAVFDWNIGQPAKHQRMTVWNAFDEKTKHFAPSRLPYMVNLIVDDLDGVVAKLKKARAKVDKRGIEANEFGRFAWVIDPDGRNVELWEPPLAE